MTYIFNKLEEIRSIKGCVSLALIDPDKKNNDNIYKILDKVHYSDFDAILIGGSFMIDNHYNDRIKLIKENTNKPIILFPSSSSQINNNVDAILYISLLSGRNPQYLIGEHILSAPIINNLKLETIPTGYILLNTGKISSVAAISKTNPLPMDNFDIVLAHALAGQYLGMKLIYLEAGSGSEDTISKELIQYIYKNIDIPIIVGGGIKSTKDIKKIVNSGASYVVIGNALENDITKNELKEINKVIHEKE